MKSVLGVLGLSGLIFSCSGDGEAMFSDVGGDGAGASAGSSSESGSGGSGASSSMSGSAGKSAGGSDTGGGGKGTSGSAGSDPGGGGGSGPGTPEVIFVSTSGADGAECGLTPATACLTISQGAARAIAAGRIDVYVQAGTYPGVAVLKPGVRVLGGFNADWESGSRSDDDFKVVLQGGEHPETGEFLAVWAHDLDSEAKLENLLIQGPDAEGQKPGTDDGRSSYGIHAWMAKLALKDVDITAGNGASGADGAAGLDATITAATDAMNGEVGGPGLSSNHNFQCNAMTADGGAFGTNSCASSPSTTLMSGGSGGHGGARDSKCMGFVSYVAAPGGAGLDGGGASGNYGKGGALGTGGTTCGAPGDGAPGLITNGPGGMATGGGYVADGFWYALPGGDGGTGQNGGGGGGGGGAGGCDPGGKGSNAWEDDSRGAGGGGGGAGGCAAQAGGKGGGGGGGTFGIFAVASELSLDGVTITRGSGGAGGDGGVGGQGQSGGLGQSGGTHYTPSAAPGNGGNGGHGGHGGGGAGGSGGRSIGVMASGNSTITGAADISGGAAGVGGEGGASAPTAPPAERDGHDGQPGSDGTLGETLDCGAEMSC